MIIETGAEFGEGTSVKTGKVKCSSEREIKNQTLTDHHFNSVWARVGVLFTSSGTDEGGEKKKKKYQIF